MIQQGDIFWYDFGTPRGSEPGYRRPVVVIQNDIANRSAIGTTIVCVVTTNMRLAQAPGNVLLDAGEADLPRQSVVNVSQLVTVNKGELDDAMYIGAVSHGRIDAILAGIALFLQPSQRRS